MLTGDGGLEWTIGLVAVSIVWFYIIKPILDGHRKGK